MNTNIPEINTENQEFQNLYNTAITAFNNGDYLSVITKSRKLLEQFFKSTLRKYGYSVSNSMKDNTKKFKLEFYSELLDLNNKENGKNFDNLKNNIDGIIMVISNIRNKNSDAHAPLEEKYPFPSSINCDLARLTLSLSVVIINFLEEMNEKLLPLNNNYYQLFIKDNEDFSESDGEVSMDRDRIFNGNEYTDEKVKKELLNNQGKLDDKKIMSYPIIFGNEIPLEMDKTSKFYYGRIKKIIQKPDKITIYYHKLKTISQEEIEQHIGELKIGVSSKTKFPLELHRTHWALKHVNILNILKIN